MRTVRGLVVSIFYKCRPNPGDGGTEPRMETHGILMNARQPPVFQRRQPRRQLDRGRNGTLDCATPPSEPDKRFSRIRLSGRRFPSRGLTGGFTGFDSGEKPLLRKVFVRPALMVGSAPGPFRERRLRTILRNLIRIHASSLSKVVRLLCL